MRQSTGAVICILCCAALLVSVQGCDPPPNNPRPLPARQFDIGILVKKTNQNFKSLVIDFGFCRNGANYREIELDRVDEIENLIHSLEETTAELKAIKEQIKVNEKPEIPKQ